MKIFRRNLMSEKKKQVSLKLNFIMESILSMSTFIFPLITFPYVSRILLPEGTGKVSFATSLVSYFLILTQLGIPKYGIRACAKVRDDHEELTRTAQELLIINLIMTVFTYIAFFIVLAVVPRFQEDKPLYVIVSLSILFNTIGMEWLYKALEKYTYITVRSVIFKFVAILAMFALVHTKEDYVIYGGISILASSFSNIFNFFHVHKYISMKPVGNYNLKRHWKPVVVFFAMSCATTIYTHLDTVMLGFMKTDADVGYYNAAVKIKTILVSIVTSLGTVLLPRVSYYVQNGQKEAFARITKKALNFVFLLASPLVVYFILFAKQGIYFLSGTAYAGSIAPMQLIMPTLLLIGLSNITGIQILVPTGREIIVLYSEIAGAIVDIIINALLIPGMASAGAAIGTLVAEAVVLGVQLYFIWSEVKEAFKSIHYMKIVIAICLGSAASLWVALMGLGNFVTLLVSAILFFGVYGIVLLLTKEALVLEILTQVTGKFLKKKG